MQLTKHLNKISWSVADKSTYVLYGFATIAILAITNEIEYGIFSLFNYLHNFIFNISDSFTLQSLLQFSAVEEEKPRVNLIALINHTIFITIIVLLVLIFKSPISVLLSEPKIINVANALPLLALFSIPRYFCYRIMYRELKTFRLFMTNLVYFGSMSFLILYCYFQNFFLTYSDIINITYLGSALGTIVAILLSLKYLKFSFKGKTKYSDIMKFSAKYTVGSIILPIPRYCDIFFIQYFWGTSFVGLYSPAKTLFRFIDELINTVYSLIYSPSVKYIAKNDIKSLNSIITKSVSLLLVTFSFITLLSFLGVSDYFSVFLPNKFVQAIPLFNILMLSSILLPITLLTSTISASGKPEIVAKYSLFAFLIWIISFMVIGFFFNSHIILIPIPFVIFQATIAFCVFRYANKHFNFQFKQLFRIIPDGLMFIKNKFK